MISECESHWQRVHKERPHFKRLLERRIIHTRDAHVPIGAKLDRVKTVAHGAYCANCALATTSVDALQRLHRKGNYETLLVRRGEVQSTFGGHKSRFRVLSDQPPLVAATGVGSFIVANLPEAPTMLSREQTRHQQAR